MSLSLTTRCPSSTPRVCTDGVRLVAPSYADVITKFSWLDELQIFLKYGSSLRALRAQAPLIRDLLSNTQIVMSMWLNFAGVYLLGMRDRSMRSGTELA